MHLVADVLDELLCDVNGKRAGRIDGIVLQLRDDRPPRLAYVEVSPITLLARFNRRFASWYAGVDRRFGKDRGKPFRIPWNRLEREKESFTLNFDAEASPIFALEDWLREKIVERIPGS